MGGDTAPPDTATRNGWATFPSATACSAATPEIASCSAGARQSSSAANRATRRREQRDAFGREMFLRRLLVVAGHVTEEEEARFRHLLERLGTLLLRAGDRDEPRAVLGVHAEGRELRPQVICQVLGCGPQDVLLVGPEELVGVEGRGRLVDVHDVEQPDHFLEREDLLVAVRPAEPAEIVEQRLGQETRLAVLQDAHRAVTLGELRAVGPEDHRQVCVHRRLDPHGAQHVDLPRRVVDVVVAADHVRDAHVVIVDDDAEVVGWRAVRAGDDQVVELGTREGDGPVDDVVDDHGALVRVAEAHDRIDACARRATVTAATVVPGLLLARELRRAHFLELLLRAITVISLALAEEPADDFGVSIEAPGLVERSLVVIEAQPLHAVEDHLHGFLRRTLSVGVLDAQDEHAAVAPRVQPAEKRRAHAADVQQAGGARGKAGAHGHERFWMRTRRLIGPAR